VKLNRPIRVTGTPVDGGAQVEFLGFIDEWPIEWTDGTDTTAYVTVSASSRLSRLGTQQNLKSIVESAILADSPVAYYTLGEPAGSTEANDSSGGRALRLEITRNPSNASPIVFGNAIGPGTDGLTAAQFAAGDYLRSPGTATAYAGVSIEACFSAAVTPVPDAILALLEPSGSTLSLQLGQVDGKVGTAINNGAGLTTSGSMCDGNTHHACATWDGTTHSLYVDGALIATQAVAGTPQVGTLSLGQNLVGVEAHVAVFGSALSAAQVAAHASAALTGYAGDTTSARLIRYAGYAGVPSAEISSETGQTTVQHIDTTDKQPVELMRVMETTEGGVLFDGRDGLLYFQNRAHRLTEASLFTLNMAQHMVESDYSPKMDRTTLVNDVSAQDVTGQFTAHVFDAQSRNTDHGVATASVETASQDDDEPLFLASWMVYKYKQPAVRIPSLTVNCLDQVSKTPNCAAVLAANVGDKITVSGRPSQDTSSSASFFIEGYTRVYGPESCKTTFNVSPSSPDDTTLVIGDASRGVIGTNPVAL
jgi:hypothetical protein